MKKRMSPTKIIFIAITFLCIVSCVDDDDNGNIIDNSVPNSIINFITNNEEYSTLLAAINQTGLTATLAGAGPFTLFAPDNDAFNAFLGETALEDMDNELLTQVLLNHVLNISVDSDQLLTSYFKSLATEAFTDTSLDLYINTSSGILINGLSEVTTPDIDVDNGTIHAVSTVIGLPDLSTFITADPNFNSLIMAFTADASFNYIETLQTPSETAPAPFTLFAPDTNALTTLLTDLNVDNFSEIDPSLLAATLDLHIIEGANVRANALTELDGESLETSGGLPITIEENPTTVIDPNGEESLLIATDIQAVNGVIHTINNVLGGL